MLLAVAEQHAEVPVGHADVFASVAGGIRVSDAGADLAIAIPIASAWSGIPVPAKLIAVGEIGLGGEVRQAAQTSRGGSTKPPDSVTGWRSSPSRLRMFPGSIWSGSRRSAMRCSPPGCSATEPGLARRRVGSEPVTSEAGSAGGGGTVGEPVTLGPERPVCGRSAPMRANVLVRWAFTVFSAMPRRRAISLFGSPSATSVSTSRLAGREVVDGLRAAPCEQGRGHAGVERGVTSGSRRCRG